MPAICEQAEHVVAAFNGKLQPTTRYRLGSSEPNHATRDFVFASIKSDGRTFNVFFDVHSQAGYVRETTVAGLTVVAVSAIAATSLGVAMHALLTS